MITKTYLEYQCDLVGECFVLSGRDGYDSEDFAEKFLTSDYGIMVLTDKRGIEYSDAMYMLEGLTMELDLHKGPVYEEDLLNMAGYIYKYWTGKRKTDPRRIYRLAPIRLLHDRYGFYHTQGYDYIIDDIIRRPYRK